MFHPDEMVNSMNSIVDGKLYLGNRYAASALDILKNVGVTHVVNAAEEQPNFHPEKLIYYNCHLKDDFKERLDFEGPLRFIQEALSQGGVVFVHCLAGVSRSATIVVAYLMKAYRLRVRDALLYVRKRRPVIHPNSNYLQQLERLDLELFRQVSVDVTEALAQRLKAVLAILDSEAMRNVVPEDKLDSEAAVALQPT